MSISLNPEDIIETAPLLDDRDVGRLLNFSTSWVRQQRRNRRLGLKHAFTLDPVMVGDGPRYDPVAFAQFMQDLKAVRFGADLLSDNSPPDEAL